MPQFGLQKVMKIKTLLILLTFFVSVISSGTQAETKFDIGLAIGGYLTATDLLEKFNDSECGYINKRKGITLLNAIRKTYSKLPEELNVEFKSLIESEHFEKKMSENDTFIIEFLIAGKKDHLDKNTLCGMLSSILTGMYSKQVQLIESVLDEN